MFNLPGICQVYNTSMSMAAYWKISKDYRIKKAQASAQPNFDEAKFTEKYCQDNGLSAENLQNVNSLTPVFFNECSKGLGSYELATVNGSLNYYSSCQKKTKKIINYFDLNLESLVSSDNAGFDNTSAKVTEIGKGAEEALKEYSKRFKGAYDNLTIDDFKGKNVKSELAMQRFANYIAFTFSNSSQVKAENKKAATAFGKKAKQNIRKIALSEQKKLKLNNNAADGYYASNYTRTQVDDLLGSDYAIKTKWNENLTGFMANAFDSLIKSASK